MMKEYCIPRSIAINSACAVASPVSSIAAPPLNNGSTTNKETVDTDASSPLVRQTSSSTISSLCDCGGQRHHSHLAPVQCQCQCQRHSPHHCPPVPLLQILLQPRLDRGHLAEHRIPSNFHPESNGRPDDCRCRTLTRPSSRRLSKRAATGRDRMAAGQSVQTTAVLRPCTVSR